MASTSLKRRLYLRAPLRSRILLVNDDIIYKSAVINISESGILIHKIERDTPINALHLLISLCEYPDLNQLGRETLMSLSHETFKTTVWRLKARIVRVSPMTGDLGCEFVGIDKNLDLQKKIQNYVALYARNLIFLLGLFEGRWGQLAQEDSKALIRKTAQIIGYDVDLPIAQLRLKTLHDYQSLESL